MKAERKLTVLDCTFRDGGYYNNWVFERDLVNRYVSATSAAGLDVIEIGFRQPAADKFLGPLAFSSDRYLESLNLPSTFSIAVMSDAKVLLREGPGDKVTDALYGPSSECPVDIVRIAAGIAEVPELGPAIKLLKKKGYTVCLNIMQMGNKPPEQISGLASTAAAYDGVDVLYFADSFGNMNPQMVAETVDALRVGWSGPLGIHTHDNMNMGLANSMAALDAGVSWIDGTVLGMGRGAGNVAMEYLLHALQERGYKTYHCEALLPLLLEDFVALRQRYGWGPNFLYYLAALHEIHPTFLQRLQDADQHDMEGLANALDYLRASPSKAFSEEALFRAMRAEKVSVKGDWSPSGWADGQNILLVANGPGSREHKDAIAHFIATQKPRVIALNYTTALDPALIDAYAVCHPGRLMHDLPAYKDCDRPLILPKDQFAEHVTKTLGNGSSVHNFGIDVEPGVLQVSDTSCKIPARKVAPYALAICAGAGAKRVFLAGFDGFDGSDPRHQEMNAILEMFYTSFPDVSVVALTPSNYNVQQSSIYAY